MYGNSILAVHPGAIRRQELLHVLIVRPPPTRARSVPPVPQLVFHARQGPTPM